MRYKAIGIDPDSAGAVCVLVNTTLSRTLVREYSITGEALGQFVRWIKEQADTVVALEGRNGVARRLSLSLGQTDREGLRDRPLGLSPVWLRDETHRGHHRSRRGAHDPEPPRQDRQIPAGTRCEHAELSLSPTPGPAHR